MNAPWMPAAESSAAWIADRMLSSGGWVIVIDVECAFDESGTHEGSPILCVAGYIMERAQARELDREWDEVLNWDQLPHKLPYFHMSDCAPDPGNGVFAGLTKPQRIQVVSRMMAVIKRRTVLGLAATVNVSEFESIMGGHPLYPDPYVLIAQLVLSGVVRWLEANDSKGKRVAYFFETGHKSRADADYVMQRIFTSPLMVNDYRYAGHAFVPKLGNPVVQAADLLAWQWLKDRKNQAEGRPRRKDLQSLLIHPHATAHVEPSMLARLALTREPAIRVFAEALAKGRSS